MKRPTQTVHILTGKKKYTFDAVIKTEHSHIMDVLEDRESAKGKAHKNYAVKKPSTIVMEVAVSDSVVITTEPLTRGARTRSGSAYKNLYALQQARNFLTVVTRMHTFKRMLLSEIVVVEDNDHQNEFYANIAFKELSFSAAAASGKSKNKPPPKDGDKDKADNTSVAYNWWGEVVGKGKSLIKSIFGGG